jgi:hypothetical protein
MKGGEKEKTYAVGCVQHVDDPQAADGVSVFGRDAHAVPLLVEVDGGRIVDAHDRVARIIHDCQPVLEAVGRRHVPITHDVSFCEKDSSNCGTVCGSVARRSEVGAEMVVVACGDRTHITSPWVRSSILL